MTGFDASSAAPIVCRTIAIGAIVPVSPLFRPIDVAPAYQKVPTPSSARSSMAGSSLAIPSAPSTTSCGSSASTARPFAKASACLGGGLISRNSSRRLHACLPRYSKLASRLSRALVLHEVTFRELYEASMTLEVASIGRAVERATEENLTENWRQPRTGQRGCGWRSPALRMRRRIPRAGHKGLAELRVLQLAREPAAQLFYPTTEMIVTGVAEGGPRLVPAPPSHRCDPSPRQRGRRALDAPALTGLGGAARDYASLDRSVEHMFMGIERRR